MKDISKLIKELVRATTNKDSIVLDFFAGSGTTGHAVIDLNKEEMQQKYVKSLKYQNNNQWIDYIKKAFIGF